MRPLVSHRLFREDIRINTLRARSVESGIAEKRRSARSSGASWRAPIWGEILPQPEEVANAILALCSGMMDGVSGQVVMIDRGGTFRDNLMVRMFNESEHLTL